MKSSASELGLREYSIKSFTICLHCLPQLPLPVCDSLTEDYDVFKEQMNQDLVTCDRWPLKATR